MSLFAAIRRALFGPSASESREAEPPVAPPSGDARGEPPASKSDKYLSDEEAGFYFVPGPDGQVPVWIGGGFFVHAVTGRMVPPGNRHLQRLGVRSFNVRGTRHYPAEALAAETSPGTAVVFRREPENAHDPNAVAVVGLDAHGEERRVGYVNKGYARYLSKRLDAGVMTDAWFMRGAAAGDEDDGISVLVTDRETATELFNGEAFTPRP